MGGRFLNCLSETENGLLKCLLEFLKLNVYLGVGSNFQPPVQAEIDL